MIQTLIQQKKNCEPEFAIDERVKQNQLLHFFLAALKTFMEVLKQLTLEDTNLVKAFKTVNKRCAALLQIE